MSGNISWLDCLSFVVSLLTFAVAYKFDRKQELILKDVRRREKEIADKVDTK